jgi:dihydroflavonol-4-reductase
MSSNQCVFVTGGSGVVGRAVVKRLVRDDREVRALARSTESRSLLKSLGARPVDGDLESLEALIDGMAGCSTVFHVAGMNAFCVPDPSKLFSVNVLGSLNVVTAAARARVARIVYTSSASTLGEPRGTVGNEDSEHRGYFLSEYERSKFEAERVVLKTAGELGVEAVCVNPSSVQGPGRVGGTGKILVLYLNGKLRFFVRTQVSLVDIDDCAEGHALAEQKGQPGGRYVLNSATMPIQDALAIVRRVAGGARKPKLLPGPLAMGAASLIEVVGHMLGKHPAFCREMVRTLLHGHRYDGSKAARELGLTYTPAEDTLARTIDWLRSEGLVPARV